LATNAASIQAWLFFQVDLAENCPYLRMPGESVAEKLIKKGFIDAVR
jgi:hypothetical protein